jgi:outer membrane protein assembly factor BamB
VAGGSGGGSGDWSAELLPAPSFPEAPPSAPSPDRKPVLERVSSKPNEITDEEAWFTRNGLERPERAPESLPESVPRQFRDASLVRAFVGGDSLFLLYGKDFGDLRYLMAADPKTYAFKYGYDFQSWTQPPGEEGEFTDQRVLWAVEEDGILYVSHGHSTYAKDSRGRNAYLTAIDPKKDEVLWRSRPLVANAHTFLVLGDRIVSGYGFTAEPDFLYLIDRKTGEVAERHPLKTGPEQILLKEGLIYVRCYDTDEVFRLRS